MIDKTEKAIKDGRDANFLLNNPIFKQALEDLDADLVSKWKNGTAESAAHYWAMWQALREFMQRLETYIVNGNAAEKKLGLKE